MPQFRKRPVVIEAVQFRAGEQPYEFAADVASGRIRYTEEGTLLIATLEGVMEAQPGDWIITGVKGERYPCKPDIFAATYEPAPIDTVTPPGGPLTDMDFGEALYHLRQGRKVARAGWNGKGMFLYHVPANSYPAQTDVAKAHFGDMVPYGAYIAMKSAQGNVVPWLASQTDMLAEDWEIVG